ncbi:MAG TPA: 2-amino-4-hydroxy-6-hydroxymethyldihydropteridine diphosphokinase [Usitatibacter sp.]|nr:2-amino-4-hydroxy-6-hydroxymethyldihydropteridine diphosphokinase [Usitatibacter sp.]
MPTVRAVVALGSNLDDPEAHVRRGFADLALVPETWVVARSKLYRTKPVGYADQPDFVNACALVETRLPARQLLEALLAIEKRHGRVREIRNGPRTLDLDIVLYGGAVIDEPGLAVPHPRAHERAFVLQPLLDVWPEAEIPGKGKASELLALVTPAKAGAHSGRDALGPGRMPQQSGPRGDGP